MIAYYIAVFCASILLILTRLIEQCSSNYLAGFLFALILLLLCRCNYTGLLCHLFTNQELYLTPMRPFAEPDLTIMIDVTQEQADEQLNEQTNHT